MFILWQICLCFIPIILSNLIFYYYICNSFLLNGTIPIILNISANTIFFIFLSNGLELLSDGETLTYISHGLKFSSIKMSNPYSSKHIFLFLTVQEIELKRCDYAENIVFIIISLIFANSVSTLTFSYFRYYLYAFRLHLLP